MTQAVYIAEAHFLFLAELFEPTVWCLIIHRLTAPFDKESVALFPLVTETLTFPVLFVFQLFEHIHNVLRKLLTSLRLARFRGICVDTSFLCVVRCTADFDDIAIPINVFPFQSEKLPATESAINRELEKYAIFEWNIITVKQSKELGDLLDSVDVLLNGFAFGTETLRQGLSVSIPIFTA